MSETSLPPPTKNSNGRLIVGGLIVLLVLGGVFVWKATSNDVAQQPIVAPTASVAPSVVAHPAPPPPPPVMDDPPAASTQVASTPKLSTPIGPRGDSGCANGCAGSADSSLRAALRQRGGAAKGCYDKALRTKPTLQGKLMVAVRISPYGTVCSASVVSDSLGDPGVSNCILQNFRSASYPKPKGGCVDVQVPLNLIPSAK